MNKVYLMDCMDLMKDLHDNAFELAIVDPPYGIGNFVQTSGNVRGDEVTWNDNTPSQEYFTELKRVSKERIIWGANYYNCFEKGGAIVWDKRQPNPKMSQCEIASYSRLVRVAYYYLPWNNFDHKGRANIHPWEKPVALYKWLLKNYAKPGDKILDTHIGSGSIRIACHDMGFGLVGCEIDLDYWKAQEERFQTHIEQGDLFGNDEMQNLIYKEKL